MRGPDQPRVAHLEALATEAGIPLVEGIARLLRGPLRFRHTLLAVCPNSEAVVRAALEAAKEADAPLLFAATLNQVDTDGGYTGWTPQGFAAVVRQELHHLGADVPVILCLDHGGPWKKDAHAAERLTHEDALRRVETSIAACLEAEYGYVHLDATAECGPEGIRRPTVGEMVERTAHLVSATETCRRGRGLRSVAYEVGTEETGHPITTEARFHEFLEQLIPRWRDEGLPAPCFAVGDVGTSYGTTDFDGPRAKRLAEGAYRHGLLLKAHYTDGVSGVASYPECGIGGANVGPGFAAEEYAALMDLVVFEHRLSYRSGFPQAIRRALIESGRWQKWRQAGEAGAAFEDLPDARQQELLATGSRYVWTHPAVVDARERLYRNVSNYTEGEAYVRRRLKGAIVRYFQAFNLVGFTETLVQEPFAWA